MVDDVPTERASGRRRVAVLAVKRTVGVGRHGQALTLTREVSRDDLVAVWEWGRKEGGGRLETSVITVWEATAL